MSIRVMLADDHILMREGIRQLLECDNSVEIVGEVSNGEQCLEMIYKVRPQVLLLDINMPVKNGIEVLREIRNNHLDVTKSGRPGRPLFLFQEDPPSALIFPDGPNPLGAGDGGPQGLIQGLRVLRVHGHEKPAGRLGHLSPWVRALSGGRLSSVI